MHIDIKKISLCSLLIALSFALSKIKILPMPFGGSVTLFSMFFITLPGFYFGLKYGFMSSIIYAFLKLFLGGYVYSPFQALFDYILSYVIFFISGIFYKYNDKKNLIFSYLIPVILRFIFNVISGYLFFSDYAPKSMNPITYTILYNAFYIFTEAILTIIIISIPYVYKFIIKIKEIVNR